MIKNPIVTMLLVVALAIGEGCTSTALADPRLVSVRFRHSVPRIERLGGQQPRLYNALRGWDGMHVIAREILVDDQSFLFHDHAVLHLRLAVIVQIQIATDDVSKILAKLSCTYQHFPHEGLRD